MLAEKIGLKVPAGTQLLYGETDASHVFVSEEQMMPFVPFVRAKDAEAAIHMAHESEHDFGHTGIIHRATSTQDDMGKLMNTTLYIKNGPWPASASARKATCRSASRRRPARGLPTCSRSPARGRCVMVDELRVVRRIESSPMQLAKIIGKATATMKHPTLEGRKPPTQLPSARWSRRRAVDRPRRARQPPRRHSDGGHRRQGDQRTAQGQWNSPARCIVLGQVMNGRHS
ncbi:MAG: hypothetical protein U0992_09595 [Planctomycetaceae bacterium]